ncbi:MAG TPA: HAMP domain-containing sensor histidine kinase, partial [Victivallales bacterium]|nr:HAMP domain-containing sensor histidine kinase [Victivallales bacterium]
MGELMADFNSMASRLERQTHQLKKINEELEKKAEELLEANQHKDRFFANMSHELRTPLNSIIGFADLNIARTDYSGEKLIDNSKKILIAAEHLLSLISGLLDIAKSDAGVLKPIMEKNNISNTLNMVVDMLKPIVERKKLYLELQSSSNIEFYYDEKLIKQVLINLINNAIKFTHEGGIKIRLIETSENVEIEIEDSGIGISEEDQKKIFKDFHRVESGLTSNYEGAGLGLALSRRFVRMHGGEISLESQIGKGSIFKISLPKKQNIA